MATSPITNRTYEEPAKTKFLSLQAIYDAGTSYWQLGNSFDTMIDFLDIVGYNQIEALADKVKKAYDESLANLHGYDNAWFDDFGWWTIAAQRAAERTYFGKHTEWFRGITNECWKRFSGNAPYVWARHKPGTFDDYRPAVEGGACNEYWLGTSTEFPGPKDGDPSHDNGRGDPMHGVQNTVTNALFLIAAQRRGDASAEAQREYRFLYSWLWEQKQDPLWWRQSVAKENACLVRERVSHFHDGRKDTAFQENWAWTGDQGLILGALTDRIRQHPDERLLLVGPAKELLRGVRDVLAYENGVLQPWSQSGTCPNGYANDYKTGTIAFWRNLLYAWKTDPDLHAFLNTEYREFLKKNADHAAGRNVNDVTELTSDLAVLVAATAMLH